MSDWIELQHKGRSGDCQSSSSNPKWCKFVVVLHNALKSPDLDSLKGVVQLIMKERYTPEHFTDLRRIWQNLNSLTEKGSLRLYVVGESNSGKSTLINACLTVQACPVEAHAETVHITQFSIADSWEIVDNDEIHHLNTQEDFEKCLEDIIRRNPEISMEAKIVKAQIPHGAASALLKRTSFVDTPGVSERYCRETVSEVIRRDDAAVVACVLPLTGDSMVQDKLSSMSFLNAFKSSVSALSPLLFIFTRLDVHYDDISRTKPKRQDQKKLQTEQDLESYYLDKCTNSVQSSIENLRRVFPGAHFAVADCNDRAKVCWNSAERKVVKCTQQANPLEELSAALATIAGESKVTCWCVGSSKVDKAEFVSQLSGAKANWDQDGDKITIAGTFDSYYTLLLKDKERLFNADEGMFQSDSWDTLQVPIEKAPNLKYITVIDTAPNVACEKILPQPQDWLVCILPLNDLGVAHAIFLKHYAIRARKLFVLTKLSDFYEQAKKNKAKNSSELEPLLIKPLLIELSEVIKSFLGKIKALCPGSECIFFDNKTNVFWNGESLSTSELENHVDTIPNCVSIFRRNNMEAICCEAVHDLLPIAFDLFNERGLKLDLENFDAASASAIKEVQRRASEYLNTLPKKIENAFHKTKLEVLETEKAQLEKGRFMNQANVDDVTREIQRCKALRLNSEEEELPGDREGLKQFQKNVSEFVHAELQRVSAQELNDAYAPLSQFCQEFKVNFNRQPTMELTSMLNFAENFSNSKLVAGILAVGAGAGAGVGGAAATAALGIGAAIGIGFAVAIPAIALLGAVGYFAYQHGWSYGGQVEDMELLFQTIVGQMKEFQLRQLNYWLENLIQRARHEYIQQQLANLANLANRRVLE